MSGTIYYLNKKRLYPNQPFSHNGIQYSSNWLTKSSPSERQSLGIVEIIPEQRPNDKFYTITNNNDGTYFSIEKPISDIKKTFISEIKEQAFSILSKTDWVLLRNVENNKSIDPKIRSYREHIRNLSNQFETEINYTLNVEGFEKLIFNWPQLENFNPEIAQIKLDKIKTTWEEMWYLLELSEIVYSIGGITYYFGADRESRENITGINVAISRGISIPNPRPWTPRRSVPVLLSHDDLANIGALLLEKKDQFIKAYFVHKVNIDALSTVDDVLNYNNKTGWPS